MKILIIKIFLFVSVTAFPFFTFEQALNLKKETGRRMGDMLSAGGNATGSAIAGLAMTAGALGNATATAAGSVFGGMAAGGQAVFNSVFQAFQALNPVRSTSR